MDGAIVIPKAAKVGTSGNSQILSIQNHPFIKEVQFSLVFKKPQHQGQYYKLTYTDGTKVKIIDPKTYKGGLDNDTLFYDRVGDLLDYQNGSWVKP